MSADNERAGNEKSAELDAAFALVVDAARRDAAFAQRLLSAVMSRQWSPEAEGPAAAETSGAGQGDASPHAEVAAATAAPFDPYEPNLEVAVMQNREGELAAQLVVYSFAQLAKIVKAQRVANVRPLFGGTHGEPASKERIVEAIVASVRQRVKGRFSAAS
jgi:hypothetical protein